MPIKTKEPMPESQSKPMSREDLEKENALLKKALTFYGQGIDFRKSTGDVFIMTSIEHEGGRMARVLTGNSYDPDELQIVKDSKWLEHHLAQFPEGYNFPVNPNAK